MHYRAYQASYLKAHPLYALYKNMKVSSIQRGHKLEISTHDLEALWKLQDGRCFWSGLRMVYAMGGRVTPKAVSVDRLDHDTGYVDGNVVLCCAWANFGRQTTPAKDWKDFMTEIGLRSDAA